MALWLSVERRPTNRPLTPSLRINPSVRATTCAKLSKIEEKKLKARIIGRGWRVKMEELETPYPHMCSSSYYGE